MVDFVKWREEVNRVCEDAFGISADDMTDAPWWDLWENDYDPVEAVDAVVETYWSYDALVVDLWKQYYG